MSGPRLTEAEVLVALSTVEDPEAPIDIVELGLVEEVRLAENSIEIVLVPTYRSCPAKGFIGDRAAAAVRTLAPELEVSVRWAVEKTWSPERLAESGVQALREFGVAVVDDPEHIACPHCGSEEVEMDNHFGCAVCKSLFFCGDCRSSFEVMRGSMVMTDATARRIKVRALRESATR